MVSVIAWVQFNPRCQSIRKRTIKTEELFVSKMTPQRTALSQKVLKDRKMGISEMINMN